jgi:predicted metal-dependent phosphoesterase TrpH
MILDLHTHTRKSHDGFTKPSELLAACIARGIDAVAVTEHDLPCVLDPTPFAERGIELIPGCEFTDANGAHIIGLFVRKGLPIGLRSEAILDHIHAEGGLSVMPHPWKKGSGFMSTGGDMRLLRRFDFIEFINGGWRSKMHAADIVRIASEHNILMISSSDSHKANQVGLCCTRIMSATKNEGARAALEGARQEDIQMLIDHSMLIKHGRRNKAIQLSTAYQVILPLIPIGLRRIFKLALYSTGSDRHASSPNFECLEPGSSSW